MKANYAYLASILALLSSGCMSYLTYDRSEVLLYGVDIDQTLEVAEFELQRGKFGSVLTIWAIRDQVLSPAQAERASELYFAFVDTVPSGFDEWHLTWAIANMYRHGNEEVKSAMQKAYDDATERAKSVSRVANTHANGDGILMGDAHVLGRQYAFGHVVVPGNPKYLQSVEEYRQRRRR